MRTLFLSCTQFYIHIGKAGIDMRDFQTKLMCSGKTYFLNQKDFLSISLDKKTEHHQTMTKLRLDDSKNISRTDKKHE